MRVLCSARTPGPSTISGPTRTSDVFVLGTGTTSVVRPALPCPYNPPSFRRPATATAAGHASGSPWDALVDGFCLLQGGASLSSVRFQRDNVVGVANGVVNVVRIKWGMGMGCGRAQRLG